MEIKNYPAISAGSAFPRTGGKSSSGRESDDPLVHPSSAEELARPERLLEINAIQATIAGLAKDTAFTISRDNLGAKTRQALDAYDSQIDLEASEQKTELSQLLGIDFYV